MDKSSPSDLSGLRAIAVFEIAKGVLILLLGFGVLALIHKNLDDIAERLTEALRVIPEGKFSNLFVDLANHATDATLWVLAIGALVDAMVRSIEAFGLWRGREWHNGSRCCPVPCTYRARCIRCCVIPLCSTGFKCRSSLVHDDPAPGSGSPSWPPDLICYPRQPRAASCTDHLSVHEPTLIQRTSRNVNTPAAFDDRCNKE